MYVTEDQIQAIDPNVNNGEVPVEPEAPEPEAPSIEEVEQITDQGHSVVGAVARRTITGSVASAVGFGLQLEDEQDASEILSNKRRKFLLDNLPESDSKHYGWCLTEDDFYAQSDRLARERADTEVIEKNSTEALLWSIACGVVEAPLMPGTTLKVMKALGPGLKAAAKIGAKEGLKYGAIDSAAQMLARDEFTATDAAVNTLASGLIGSSFSSGISAIKTANIPSMVKELSNRIKMPEKWSFTVNADTLTSGGFGGIEANKTRTFKHKIEHKIDKLKFKMLDEKGIERDYTFNQLPKWMQNVTQLSPTIKGFLAESDITNRWTNAAYRHNFLLKAGAKGEVSSQSLEAGKQVRYGILNSYIDGISESIDSFCAEMKVSKQDALLYAARAIDGTDSAAPTRYANNKHISKVVKLHDEWTNQVIDDALKYKALEHDIRVTNPLGMDPKEAVRSQGKNILKHFSTVFDKTKILQEESQFKALTKQKLLRNNPNYTEKYLDDTADSIFKNITNTGFDTDYSTLKEFKLGVLRPDKEREFLTEFVDMIDFEKYLVKDPIKIMKGMHKRLATITELGRVTEETMTPDFVSKLFAEELSAAPENATKFLNDFNSKSSLEKWISCLEREERNLKKNATSDLELEVLTERFQEYQSLIKDGFAVLDNKYEIPKNVFSKNLATANSAVRMFNYVRQCGMIAISSTMDYLNLVAKHGFGKTFDTIYNSYKPNAAGKINAKDLAKFGGALEKSRAGVANAYLGDPGRDAGLDMAIDWVGETFNKVNCLTWFNKHNERAAATLHGTDILKACEKIAKGIKLSKEDETFLTLSRIPQKDRTKLYEMFINSGGKFDKDGLAIFNASEWRDDAIAQNFFASCNTAANQIVLLPSKGDIPFFMRKQWVDWFTQYQGFKFGLMNNVILPLCNDQGGYPISYFLGSIGMNYFIKRIKAAANNNPYATWDDPKLWEESIVSEESFGYFASPIRWAKDAISDDEEPKREDFGRFVSDIAPVTRLFKDLHTVALEIPAKEKAAKASGKNYVLSEWERNVYKSLCPFNNLPVLNQIAKNWIRETTAAEGGRLMKTRVDKYWESQ